MDRSEFSQILKGLSIRVRLVLMGKINENLLKGLLLLNDHSINKVLWQVMQFN